MSGRPFHFGVQVHVASWSFHGDSYVSFVDALAQALTRIRELDPDQWRAHTGGQYEGAELYELQRQLARVTTAVAIDQELAELVRFVRGLDVVPEHAVTLDGLGCRCVCGWSLELPSTPGAGETLLEGVFEHLGDDPIRLTAQPIEGVDHE